MGTYCDLSEVQDQYGTANVAAWSDLEGNDALDSDRVDRAIASAEARINGRFRGSKYSVPFAPVPMLVQDWAAKLAGIILYQHRGVRDTDTQERLAEIETGVLDQIAEVLDGTMSLTQGTIPRAPFVVA